jgi:hypothetical protein
MDYSIEHKNKIKDQYLNDPTSLYDSNFFRKRTTKMHAWELQIGKYLRRQFKLNSIVDFGCAVGSFLEGAFLAGTGVIRGYEYAFSAAQPYMNPIVKPFIVEGNVGKPIECGKFECAMSIEVAEHLIEEEVEVFIKNLTDSASKMIILTAAPPEQDGFYHLTLKPYEFWIEKIESKGWKYNKKLVEQARRDWKGIPKVPNHIFTNIMIFTPKETK